MNIIDFPPYRFVRSELATLRTQFAWVAAIAPALDAYPGGNVVLVAAHHRPFSGAFATQVVGDQLLEGPALDAFVGGAPVIRDDYAPIDQWLDADRG